MEVAMRLRASMTAAVAAAGLLLSTAAHAQGSASASASAPVEIIDVERFFSAPRALGDAWERAVQAALDGMRALRDAERAALRPVPTPPRAPSPPWSTIAPAPREVPIPRYVVTLQPVVVEPVTQAVIDARGQRATLLGASVEMPWPVP
ncbi:Hypothetical protein A7982_00553 [Minicystis rosea]|nr:Hypothetical protein A7982_00553 [Minicystis rosea]